MAVWLGWDTQGNFWGLGNVLYLEYGGDYTGVQICQNLPKYIVKMGPLDCI